MKLLLDFPTIGEPHYAQAIPARLIKDKQVKFYKLAENTHPVRRREPRAEAASRATGKRVHVKMIAIRSHFAPDNIEGVQVGDTVYFHVTNIEQDWDILHGFAVLGASNVGADSCMPGETRTMKWMPKRAGVYPFYCTDFCSALHQEMQGYIRVSPRDRTCRSRWNSLRPRARWHGTTSHVPTARTTEVATDGIARQELP